MQTATPDPTAGETARRLTPHLKQAEQVGDPTDPRFHERRLSDWHFDDPRLRREAEGFAPRHATSRRSLLSRPHIEPMPRPSDRPLGSTHKDPGAAFLPAYVLGDPPAGHVLGHPRDTILDNGAEAEGRPVGLARGRKPGERQPGNPDRPGGHVPAPRRRNAE